MNCRFKTGVWTRFQIIASVVLALPLIVDVSSATADASRKADPNLLTVTDSIEMTHFTDPPETSGAHPQYSPDHNMFLVVTERGRVDLNVRDFALLVFQANEPTKEPERIFSLQSSSNHDAISQPRWLDNDFIGFIGEGPGEVAQAYLVNWRTRQKEKLTSDEHGVTTFDISPDRSKVAYYAIWSGGDGQTNEFKDKHGFVVNDESLVELVTGAWMKDTIEWRVQLYIKDLKTGKTLSANSGPMNTLSRQPIHFSWDGRFAVTVQPPFEVPDYWQQYSMPWLREISQANHGRQPWLRAFPMGQYMLVDTLTGDVTPLMDGPTPGGAQAQWSPDSRSVAICCQVYLPLDTDDPADLARRKKTYVLAEVDVKSRTVRRIMDIPDDQYWALESGDAPDMFRIVVSDFHLDYVGRIIDNIYFKWDGTDWKRQNNAQAHKDDIIVAESLTSWPKLTHYNAHALQESAVFDPNPQLRTKRFGRVETIRWVGKQGENLTGGLYYPTDYVKGQRYPVVFQTHGYSPDSFAMDGSYTTANAARALASKGIAVVQIGDSPLSDTYEHTLDRGRAMQSQIESCIDFLDEQGIADRKNVALVGFSSTAYDTRYILMHSRYTFAAATEAEGIDFGYWTYVAYLQDKTLMAADESHYGGSPWTKRQSWLDNSISFNFDKIHTPVLLQTLAGTVMEMWENFVALKRLNRPVELLSIPHGDHVLVKPWERMTSQQGNVDWMVFWLKGEEDNDPAKTDQYARWRELRKLHEADMKRQPQ